MRRAPVEDAGGGVFAPFGLSMKWPENTGFRSVALEGSVQYLTVQPVIAWQVFGPTRGVHAASAPDAEATSKRAEVRAPGFEPDLSLAIGPPLTLNWRSSWYFGWGVTRKFGDGWRASAGYIFSENSVPDANFTPLVPDTDRHAWSVGIGRDMGKWSWDIAYQLTRGVPRTVNGSAPTLAGQTADGRYEWWSHALALSVGRKF